MDEEESIFVTYKGDTHQFLIEDIEPDLLQETFALNEIEAQALELAKYLNIYLET